MQKISEDNLISHYARTGCPRLAVCISATCNASALPANAPASERARSNLH
jgi:hypothetical protein